MKRFRIINYEIPLDREKYHPSQKIRIVFLSDLHNQVYGEANDILLKKIEEQKPDLIAVAGDLLTSDGKENEWIALELMKALGEKYPVYYANGNHECRMKQKPEIYGERYQNYASELRSYGVHLLENEAEDLMLYGVPIRIYGLEISLKYYQRFSQEKLTEEEIHQSLGFCDRERYTLLLAHNPMCFSAYAEWGADLTFSGHLHGGFLRIPLIGGVISPQCVLFPKYDRGLFEVEGHKLIVGAGIGTHSKIPRLGNPPELVVVDLC